MRRVALIYNPASGQQSSRHRAAIDKVLATLHAVGIETQALETRGPGDASARAWEAIHAGCDTILACGGDGTVHEVLQSLVGTRIALGVIPLGTANALAQDLGLGTSPSRAIRKLLAATPVRVSVGHITFRKGKGKLHSRYFTVAAGVGADALFLSHLDAGLKRRFGYALYFFEGVRLWATHSFPLFQATFFERGSSEPRVEEISQLLAVRIRNFGGVLHNFAPGATLHADGLRLIAFRSRLRYFRFLLAVIFGRQTFSRDIELLDAVSVECRLRDGAPVPVFAEADGELLGHLPVHIDIVPDAVTLLIPPGARP
jgi:diacylglycerol kinase family enzyme